MAVQTASTRLPRGPLAVALVLLSGIALTRLDPAMEFLLDLVRTESLDAEGAIEAILRAAPSDEIVSALENLVRDWQRRSQNTQAQVDVSNSHKEPFIIGC